MLQSNSLRYLAVIPPLLGIMLAQGGCNRNSAGAGGPPPGVAVTAVTATSADVPVYLDEIGKATASQSVTVLPQVSGPIMARHFQDGCDLKKGQLLFEIDPRPFQAQLDQAKGQLLKDQAQKALSEWNVQQDTAALATKAISEQQLHTDEGTRDEAVGAIAVDQAQIAAAKLNVEYCHITSPIDGRAGERLVDVGNVVNSAGVAPGTNLLSIQTLDPIYADFTITEGELLKVQQYMSVGTLQVQVELPQDAIVAAGPKPATQPTSPPPDAEATPEAEHPQVLGIPSPVPAPPTTKSAGLSVPRVGQLTFLDNAVQDGTGTVKLRATLPNLDHHFWPGQFVNVRLILTVQKHAVLIPNSATQISQKGPFVYVVKPDSTAALTPITLGQRQGDMVVVESGLNSGDQVVLTGQLMVMDKAKVIVVNQPAGHGGGGAASASAKGAESNGGSL